MEMPNLWIAAKCYKVLQNLTSPYVTEYSHRNNGMLRSDLQTDLVTFISLCFDTFRKLDIAAFRCLV